MHRFCANLEMHNQTKLELGHKMTEKFSSLVSLWLETEPIVLTAAPLPLETLLVNCGGCCGGGTMPLLREDVLLSGPLLSAHFSVLGLDSASLVSWAKPKEDGGRRRMILQGNQSRHAWVGHELAPMLQLTQDLSFCPTVTSWKCLPRGSRLPWKETCYLPVS